MTKTYFQHGETKNILTARNERRPQSVLFTIARVVNVRAMNTARSPVRL